MIAVIDYEMGNLRSVQKALQTAGGDARIVTDPDQVRKADRLVLPGVGAFRNAIARLRSHHLAEPIGEAVTAGKPILGICLGLQMLFDVSFEDGQHEGLSIVPGRVVRFEFDPDGPQRLSVPHMGWNQLSWQRDCPLLTGVEPGAYVYFAHSYHVAPRHDAVTLTTTEYGSPFVSAIWRDNLFATQFHPEKSQAVGLKMLENFVRL